MPPLTPDRAASSYEINEALHCVNLTRHLSAGVEQTFEFWTDPRHIKQWWDTSGEPLSDCKIDLRVGGQMLFVSARPGLPHFIGRYLEIDPPRRLVFEAMGAIGTVSIAATISGSRVEVQIRAPDAESLQAMLAMGVAVGTAQTLDNLRTYSAKGDRDVIPGLSRDHHAVR